MRVMRGGNLRQFGSIASLATETTDGEILVAFLAQTSPNMCQIMGQQKCFCCLQTDWILTIW